MLHLNPPIAYRPPNPTLSTTAHHHSSFLLSFVSLFHRDYFPYPRAHQFLQLQPNRNLISRSSCLVCSSEPHPHVVSRQTPLDAGLQGPFPRSDYHHRQ